MRTITTITDLEALYGPPVERALLKEIDHINDHYCQFIEASSFVIMATMSDAGLDCSPRGDPPGFVKVVDSKTLHIPDRRGNNRLDSLRNIVANRQISLLFMLPGVGETIRVSGTADIIVDRELCQSFAEGGKAASSVLSITVEKAYFQCQKAIARGKLWQPTTGRADVPTAGQMSQHFAAQRGEVFDGDSYDKNYPQRIKDTLY